MTDKPDWGDDNGVVTSYMCKIAYDHELGHTSTKLYPSVRALREDHSFVDDCGIVKVAVKSLGEIGGPCHEGRLGWMEHVEFYHELGGAQIGNSVYSSEEACRKERPYAKKYGVVPVEVLLLEVVQEEPT